MIEISTRIDNFRSEIEDLDKRKDEIKLIIESLEQQVSDEETALSLSEEERDSLLKITARENENGSSIKRPLSLFRRGFQRLRMSSRDLKIVGKTQVRDCA